MTQYKEHRERTKENCCSKHSIEDNTSTNLQGTNGTQWVN